MNDFRIERAPYNPSDQQNNFRSNRDDGPLPPSARMNRGPVEDIPFVRGPVIPVPLFNNERGPGGFERSNSRNDGPPSSRDSYGSGSGSQRGGGGYGSRDTPYGDMPPAGFDNRRQYAGAGSGRMDDRDNRSYNAVSPCYAAKIASSCERMDHSVQSGIMKNKLLFVKFGESKEQSF